MLTLLISLFANGALADDTETYRKFELTDGRIVSGSVLSTTDDGFLVQDKTGVQLVSYDLMNNMINITKSEFESTPNSTIFIYIDKSISDRSIHPIEQAKTATKGVVWQDQSAYTFSEKDLESCNIQTMCISNLLKENDIQSMLYIHQEKNILQAYSFYSDVSLPTQSKQLEINTKYPEFSEIYALLIETLGYNTPTKPSLPLMLPPETTAIEWTTWVPLAGLPSMTARDPIGVGKSLAIAIPSGLMLIYMAGRSSSSKGQFFLTSFGAYSAASIAANIIVAEPSELKSTSTASENKTP